MRMREEPMDPGVEAELAMIERALAGDRSAAGDDPVLAELALLLREERAEPAAAWAEALDQRVAAGFPRGDGSGYGGRRLPWLGKGGWMAPAGAVATLAIVVVVATNIGGEPGGGSGGDAGSSSSAPTAAQLSPDATSAEKGATEDLQAVEGATTAEGAGISQGRRASDEIAPGTQNRKVDRNAQLTLSAQPDDVRPVTDELVSITRSLDGIVASSQVSETPDGSRAALELTIPTRNMDAALDRMTDLADVDSLNEASKDITKPFVSAQDQVKDAKAQRNELLDALGNATTDAEAQALEIRIADARKEISRAEARFDEVAREARLSDLTVSVVSDANASDERTLGDWADDALGVLGGLAGVLLIAAAILVPLGVIAAAIYLIASRVSGRRRERALD
jgi:Domain of unknown function (DUF4349)